MGVVREGDEIVSAMTVDVLAATLILLLNMKCDAVLRLSKGSGHTENKLSLTKSPL